MKITIDRELLKSVISLASVIEARDPYTGGHTWRVNRYAVLLAEKAGFTEDEVFVVSLGGMIHDLGKIGISDAILLKPDKLTEEEYAIMKQHPNIGYDLIKTHPLFAVLSDAVFSHHERVDGKGYPRQESGSEFHKIGRVMAIADAFDAMTSTRPYRKGMPAEKAIEILESEKDKQFDGTFVEFFSELYREGALNHVLGHSGDGKGLLTCSMCGPIIPKRSNAKDGDHIICPACHGTYRLKENGDRFGIEFTGEMKVDAVPQVDDDAVEEFVGKLDSTITIDI